MVQGHYADQESLLNLLIHQNALLEKIESLKTDKKDKAEETKKVVDALHRFVSHLTQNITFRPLPEMPAIDEDRDYLYPSQSVIGLFCDETTAFMLSVYSQLIGGDFVDVLGPMLVALVHVVYSRSKCPKHQRRCPILFGSFKGNKHYELVMAAGIRSGGSWIDEEFGALIARNMNSVLTFLYFGYRSLWNEGNRSVSVKANGVGPKSPRSTNGLSVLYHCSDLLVAKGKERLALQLWMDTSCCLMQSEPHNVQKTYVSNLYGLLFVNQRILAHFIRLCRLNGKRMEAVLLWQLSTDVRRIENALEIVRTELSVEDVQRVVEEQEEMGRENVFQFIWEPLIFCAIKQKFGARSRVIDEQMDAYLDSFEMGTDPKLKATKLCDFVLNQLYVQ